MKNIYLLSAVFIILAALSCKKSPDKPVISLPVCSGAPELVSQNSFPLPTAGNLVKLTQDSNGNIYTAGAYTGTINFGPSTVSGGGYFLEKTDPKGKVSYAKNLNLSEPIDYNINADSMQNVYVCYLNYNTQLPYNNIINIDKYNPQGNISWSKKIAFNMDEGMPTITVNNKGTIFMAIQNISNTVDSVYWAGFGINLYVFDTNGNLTAKKDLTDDRFSQPQQLAYSGNLYCILTDSTTTFEKLADNGNTLSSNSLQYHDPFHLFFDGKSNLYLFDYASIKKIDVTLNTIWQIKTPVFHSINSDSKGNLYIAGVFTGTVNFDTGNGTHNMTAKGSSDTFLEKIDASGKFVWAIQSLGVDKNHATSSVNSFIINPQGYIYLSGNAPNTSSGNTDIFLATYQQCIK